MVKGAEPSMDWRRNAIGNCMRDSIVEDMEERGLYYHDRKFGGRRGDNKN